MTRRRVAVLGAGIMGSSLAIYLARLGAAVTLVDRESAPMAGTSRWNEGKIHLGYLYGADSTLGTARHILPGGLAFRRLLSDLVAADVNEHATTRDDIYLVHEDSVVPLDVLGRQFTAVSDLIRAHPRADDYLTTLTAARAVPLTRSELDGLASGRIVGGFRVPERSVETQWVADAVVGAVAAESGVRFRGDTTVTSVESTDTGVRVVGSPELDEPFDAAVNALWAGRLEIDRTVGLFPSHSWSHRYRLCVFVRTRRPVDVPSALVAVGPFGDVKNYNGRDFYISWYPAGLVAEGRDVTLDVPEPLAGARRARFVADVRAGLGSCMPSIDRVFEEAAELTVAGGHVFARGGGSIGDPRSGLHRRDRFGVERAGAYFSVDTGKYSTAPWLAERLARTIMGVD
ncbi:FAD-dependent oxidoreductase [Intrasporangium sp.]|uniref:FAD-dependent oxidoreductase n=1 Tax=Intrasporangium sp. TaxID=1925024 RepID=UPI00293AE413|nr:FAD-dependent oxidoreductase [Intrasporangium sp.]MDV3223305.1 FAD-binding oxidoreductase [Intrasporangium sp.]